MKTVQRIIDEYPRMIPSRFNITPEQVEELTTEAATRPTAAVVKAFQLGYVMAVKGERYKRAMGFR